MIIDETKQITQTQDMDGIDGQAIQIKLLQKILKELKEINAKTV